MKINSLIEELDSLLGAEKIIYGKDLDEKYHHVWKMDEPLKAMAMVTPKNTDEVSEIMKICFVEHKMFPLIEKAPTQENYLPQC